MTDLIVIVVPFLRPLRALRVLRLVAAAGRAGTVFRRVSTRPGFQGFLLVALAVVAAGAGVLFAFERGAPESNIAVHFVEESDEATEDLRREVAEIRRLLEERVQSGVEQYGTRA